MNHTTNCNLPQWEADDRIHHDDFNDAMAKIDAGVAAAGNCKIVTGTYTGTGEYGEEHPNTLTFPFEPKLVIITKPPTDYSSYTSEIAVWIRGQPYGNMRFSESSGGATGRCFSDTLSWRGNTLAWYAQGSDANAAMQLNASVTYYYAAIG